MSARIHQVALALLATGLSRFAAAQTAPAAPTAVSGQLMSLVLGIALVLAVIAGAAWLLKKLSPRTYGSSSALRVVAGAAVGQRERVVIVEVGATWLVLGVAPGSVTALHQMPRAADEARAPIAADATNPFAHFLKKFMEKRGVR